MPLISIITSSLCCRSIVSTQLPTFVRNCSPKSQMKGTSIHAPFERKWSRVNWYWHDFRTQHLFLQYAIFFYNSIATKFCRLDLSLFLNVLNSNIDLTPSVSKKGTLDYKIKVKIIVNMRGHILDLYCIRLLNAPLFPKLWKALFWCRTFRKGIE